MQIATDIAKIAATLESILTHLGEFTVILNDIKDTYAAIKTNTATTPGTPTDISTVHTFEELMTKIAPVITGTDPVMKNVLESVFNKVKELEKL